MLKNKKIGVRLGALVGFMSVLLVGVGIYLLTGLSNANMTMNTNLDVARMYTRIVGDADEVQLHFKKQVQEWKDTLLRGNNPADFAQYKENFLKEESEVKRMGKELKNSMVKLGLDTSKLDEFLKKHSELGDKYREALNHYSTANLQSGHIVDRMVRVSTVSRLNLSIPLLKGCKKRKKKRSQPSKRHLPINMRPL